MLVTISVCVLLISAFYTSRSFLTTTTPPELNEDFSNNTAKSHIPADYEKADLACDESGYKIIPVENAGSEEWVRYFNEEDHFSFEFPHKQMCFDPKFKGDVEVWLRDNHETVINVVKRASAGAPEGEYVKPTLDWYLQLKMLDNESTVLDKRFTTGQGIEAIAVHSTVNMGTADNYIAGTAREIVFLKSDVLYILTVSIQDEATVNRILESFRFDDVGAN